MNTDTEEITEEKEEQTTEEREEDATIRGQPEDNTDSEEEDDELEEAFKEFKKETSEHKFSEEHKNSEITKPKINENDEFLISVFSGMFFALCDGLHGFIFNFFSKHKLDTEAVELSETQRKGLEIYLKTERVVKFLQKLSPELIGIVHMEWMYFQNMKAYNKKQDELIAEQNKKKKVIAETPVKKKKRRKKKPVKKDEG
jgi:hypothetical protein